METLGNQIFIDNDGCWKLLENDSISVKAGWLKHRIASFGFVIEQKPTPGRLVASHWTNSFSIYV